MSYAVKPSGRWEGVGGWLLIFVLVQIVALGFALFAIRGGSEARAALEGARLDPAPGLASLLEFEVNLHVVGAIGIVVGLVLIGVRWSATPLFWKIFLVASIVGLVIDVVLRQRVVDELRPLIPVEGRADFDRGTLRQFVLSIGAILGAVPWLFYWQFSKRVLNTYFHGGEEEATSGPDGDVGSRTTDPLPELHRSEEEAGFGDRPTHDCPRCGTANVLNAEYCRRCHARLEAATR